MKFSYTTITFILLFIQLISGCKISYCAICSVDGSFCKQCANGYKLDDSKLSCIIESNDSAKNFATNTGLIVGLCLSILVGICLSCFGYKKCMSNKNKDKQNTKEKQQEQLKGKVVAVNLQSTQKQKIQQNLVTLLSKEEYKKYMYLNSKCLDSPIQVDKILFKLNRKQNIFPDWSSRQFTKFTPINPSKKLNKNTQFSGYLCLIPQNVLDISKQELQIIQRSPRYEPIKKNSIDDQVTLSKNLAQNEDKKSLDLLTEQQKRRNSSLTTTDCQSNQEIQITQASEDFSQDCNKEFTEKQAKINELKQSQVTINIEDIELANLGQQNENKITYNNEEFITINIEEQNAILKQKPSYNSSSSSINQKQILSTDDGITITNSRDSNSD